MTILQLIIDHPVLSFFIAMLILDAACKIISRTLRMIMISFSGWPPAHLDADGDWKPEPEKEET